jgi:hypothetical protein
MADNFVGHDFAAKTFPFQQAVGFPLTSFTGVPWGQAIVNESWQSQTIGAGNTGTINIDVEVPNDYVSLLRSFSLCATSSSVIGWNDGVVGLAYQQPGGPYKQSVTELPETEYLWWTLAPPINTNVRDRFGSTRYYESYDISNTTWPAQVTSSQLNSPSQVPLWLPPGDATLKERAMVIYLENDTASNPAASFRFNAVFDLYTLEQAYASGVMSSPRVFS